MRTNELPPRTGEVQKLILQIELQLDEIRKGVLDYQLTGKTDTETIQFEAVTRHVQARITALLSEQIIQISQVGNREKAFGEILGCFGLPGSDWNK